MGDAHARDPRRRAPRPDHGCARRADLPDHLVRVREHRGCGRPVRAAEVREHLHAARATRPSRRSRSAIASLEGGIGAVATGSGQAAETLLFTQLCDAGDHIVASSALYGGTYTLLNVTLRRLGIETTFVAPDDPAAFAAAVQPGRTKLVYTEIVANPAGTVADLEALARGRARGGRAARGRLDARLARTSAARWTSAPTSCCTRRPSTWAGTARRSAARSWTPAASPGTTATSR